MLKDSIHTVPFRVFGHKMHMRWFALAGRNGRLCQDGLGRRQNEAAPELVVHFVIFFWEGPGHSSVSAKISCSFGPPFKRSDEHSVLRICCSDRELRSAQRREEAPGFSESRIFGRRLLAVQALDMGLTRATTVCFTEWFLFVFFPGKRRWISQDVDVRTDSVVSLFPLQGWGGGRLRWGGGGLTLCCVSPVHTLGHRFHCTNKAAGSSCETH